MIVMKALVDKELCVGCDYVVMFVRKCLKCRKMAVAKVEEVPAGSKMRETGASMPSFCHKGRINFFKIIIAFFELV